MKHIIYQLAIHARRTIWAVIVAYMPGMHNFTRERTRHPMTSLQLKLAWPKRMARWTQRTTPDFESPDQPYETIDSH
jgi:hypothetical protein